MLLVPRSTNPVDAEDELKVLGWFLENFGEADTRTVTDWVWAYEKDSCRYIATLWAIAREIREKGRSVFGTLLYVASQSPEVVDATQQLAAQMKPVIDELRRQSSRYSADEHGREQISDELRLRLREKLREMWPDKHRAMIDGALVVAFKRGPRGQVIIDFPAIAKALFQEDPLATTAAASHV